MVLAKNAFEALLLPAKQRPKDKTIHSRLNAYENRLKSKGEDPK
jgi:hypothetical protein